jgi:hypothetical protein
MAAHGDRGFIRSTRYPACHKKLLLPTLWKSSIDKPRKPLYHISRAPLRSSQLCYLPDERQGAILSRDTKTLEESLYEIRERLSLAFMSTMCCRWWLCVLHIFFSLDTIYMHPHNEDLVGPGVASSSQCSLTHQDRVAEEFAVSHPQPFNVGIMLPTHHLLISTTTSKPLRGPTWTRNSTVGLEMMVHTQWFLLLSMFSI